VNYNDIIECKNNGNAMNGVGVEIITNDIWNNKNISEAEKGISSSNVDVSSEKIEQQNRESHFGNSFG
jgi:hypothetical protein